MESALSQAEDRGWVLSWQAVRRRLYKAADSLATLGVFWADKFHSDGETAVRTHIKWAGSHTALPAHFPLVEGLD
eukprot:6665433-Pyramimonas_sp.AAC.1